MFCTARSHEIFPPNIALVNYTIISVHVGLSYPLPTDLCPFYSLLFNTHQWHTLHKESIITARMSGSGSILTASNSLSDIKFHIACTELAPAHNSYKIKKEKVDVVLPLKTRHHAALPSCILITLHTALQLMR